VRRWSKEFRKALSEDRDLLKTILEETLQQVLEGEMEEALQAGKSERTETRLGYRAGYYNRTLVTRVGKVELRVPQNREGRFRTFERRCSNATNAVRRRSWRRCSRYMCKACRQEK
jgi:transposase-like protein